MALVPSYEVGDILAKHATGVMEHDDSPCRHINWRHDTREQHFVPNTSRSQLLNPIRLSHAPTNPITASGTAEFEQGTHWMQPQSL